PAPPRPTIFPYTTLFRSIQASRVHSRQVSEFVMDEFLKWRAEDYDRLLKAIQDKTSEVIGIIAKQLNGKPVKSVQEIERIHERACVYQRKVGYGGNYQEWLEKHRPTRLEDLMSSKETEVEA